MRGEPEKPGRNRHAARWFAAALLSLPFILLPPPHALAQEIPSVGQPTANFYGAAGSGVKVAWSLDRDAVPLGEEIVATLTVSNVTNPRNVTRPDLKKLPAYHALFTVTDVADPQPPADAREVKFTYKLRPRDLAVKELPRLDFHYYNPSAAEGKQFPLTRTPKTEITSSLGSAAISARSAPRLASVAMARMRSLSSALSASGTGR